MSMPVAVVTLTVTRVEERYVRLYLGGAGAEADFEDRRLGWFAVFSEPQLAFKIGDSRPQLEAGDRVRLTIERLGCE